MTCSECEEVYNVRGLLVCKIRVVNEIYSITITFHVCAVTRMKTLGTSSSFFPSFTLEGFSGPFADLKNI